MMTNFTCTRCRNTVDEDYDLFNQNNPRQLNQFTAVCNFCARKAQAKADWVAIARTEYKGRSRLLRWFCGIQAAALFEQAWVHKPLEPEKHWWEPLPMSDEQIVKTALGEFHCHQTDDGVKVTSGPGYRPDVPPKAPPKTRQQAIEDRFMDNQRKFTDELVSSKLNIQDLCRVMELAFDKAGPDRDYSVVMEYKQAGDLATANIKLEVLGVHQVTNNVSIDVKADSPEQIARDLAAMMADKGSPDAGPPGPDLGYGSEFDLLMMAAMRHLQEVAVGVPGVTLAKFLEVPTYYNKWYAAVQADRRREWEISNTPHPEV